MGAGASIGEAWIIDGVRTPMGRHGGGLSTVRPDDLAAHVLGAILERTGVPAADVEDVALGCGNQAGEDNRDVARMALLLAGYPEEVAGVTVNRLCGSGLEAAAGCARSLMLGEGEVYVAGGVESMTRAPLAMPKAGTPWATGTREAYDTTLGWRFTNPRLDELGHTDALGITAENLAEERGIPRERQDAFALRSHQRAVAALDEGRAAEEIAPVTVTEKKEEWTLDADETPRRDSDLESLGTLPPAFKPDGGTVTAGNSSPINDGAAAVLLTSPDYARAHGLAPLARVRSIAVAGVAPRIMGIGPVPAAAKALDRAGLGWDDVGLVELNEAFAAQSLAVLDDWGLDDEDERLNPNGGAIALGHPIGCSGARILTTLVHEMRRRDDVEIGLATMCIGVGQGIALVVEKVG